MSKVQPGLFITLEGVEGAGKSVQVERLRVHLESAGLSVLTTREPGGTELGRELRSLLLRPTDTPMNPATELLLYAADRAEHISQLIAPALAAGVWVLCDRYLDATVAYQGFGRQLGADRILKMHSEPPLSLRPHRTLLFDLDVEIGLERARTRNAETGADLTEGRFEAEEQAFHQRVRDGYLWLAAQEPDRFVRVDASRSIDNVAAQVARAVAPLLDLASKA